MQIALGNIHIFWLEGGGLPDTEPSAVQAKDKRPQLGVGIRRNRHELLTLLVGERPDGGSARGWH